MNVRALLLLAHLRVVLIAPFFLAYCLIADIVLRTAFFLRPDMSKMRMVHWVTQGGWWMLSCGLGLRYEFDPRLRALAGRPGGVIVVANHNSPLDPLVLLLTFGPHKVRFISRPGIMRGIPLVSMAYRANESLEFGPDPRTNLANLKWLSARLNDDGGVVVIFPEGRKVADTYAKVLSFNSSILRVLSTAAPNALVLPLAVSGSHSAWPHARAFPRPRTRIKLIVADRRVSDMRSLSGKPAERETTETLEREIRMHLHNAAQENRPWTPSLTH